MSYEGNNGDVKERGTGTWELFSKKKFEKASRRRWHWSFKDKKKLWMCRFGEGNFLDILVAQRLKCLPAIQETLGWEDPLEKEMATHSSILAWRIPWTEEPGRLQSTGSQRVRHDLNDFTFTFHFLQHREWCLEQDESKSESHSVASDSLRPHGIVHGIL